MEGNEAGENEDFNFYYATNAPEETVGADDESERKSLITIVETEQEDDVSESFTSKRS